eukprot:3723425-Heterocapsa_arctica.AAC.1
MVSEKHRHLTPQPTSTLATLPLLSSTTQCVTSKSNKTPGPSGVPIEAIRLLDETSKLMFLQLLSNCFNSGKVSRDMNKADLAVIV